MGKRTVRQAKVVAKATMSLRWSQRALANLEEIGAFIAADDPRAAERWIQQLRARAIRAAAAPGTGRRVPEYQRDDLREVLHRSYRIIYLEVRSGIVVLLVIEGHRLLPSVDDLG